MHTGIQNKSAWNLSAATGTPVPPNVNFLPLPREHECVEVGVLLGQPGSSFPKEINGGTHLLDEGYLSDGSPVWIIYTVLQIMKPGEPPPPSSRITPKRVIWTLMLRSQVIHGRSCLGCSQMEVLVSWTAELML